MMNPAEITDSREIYYQENHEASRPWWDVPYYLTGPVKFGKWDGVFVSIIINIFGAVLFLQGGTVVGVSGLAISLVICCMIIWMGLSAGVAAIGICERTEISSGGVYRLLSKVLGGKIGAAIGLVFAFGLCVTAALYATSFATAVLELDSEDDMKRWKIAGLSMGTLIVLLLINIAGVEWVIRFQIILVVILAAAAVDFLIGPAIDRDRPEIANETIQYSADRLKENLKANWTLTPTDATPSLPVNIHNFFTIYGLFFPSITGVFAGVNMSGDLKNPAKDIPGGTIAAVCVTFILYLLFFITFASTMPRNDLITSTSPGSIIAASSILFKIGIYLSSISGCASATYQAPRLIQSIAADRAIRGLELFEVGIGGSKIPLRGILLVGFISLIFILIGNLKVISPIISISFLFVYATVEYANFSLAKAYKIKQRREVLHAPNSSTNMHNLPHPEMNPAYEDTRQKTLPRVKSTNQSNNLSVENQIARSFDLNTEPIIERNEITIDGDEAFVHSNEVYIRNTNNVDDSVDAPIIENDTMETRILERGDIRSQPQSWYKILCAPTHSLVACAFSIVMMFLINWIYSLVVIGFFLLLVYYIHVTAPGLSPGLAAHFSFIEYVKLKSQRLFNKNIKKETFLIISPPTINSSGNVETVTTRGADYSDRSNIHQTSEVSTEHVIDEWDQSHPYGNRVYA